MKATKTQTTEISETIIFVSAVCDKNIFSSVYFDGTDYEVTMKGWSDSFWFASKKQAIARAKELVADAVTDKIYA